MRRVLVVDDHAIVRTGLQRILAGLGEVDFHEAATGEQAMDLVSRLACDLLILDLSLPGLGGLELLRRLRRARPTMPVLVFSTYTEPVYVARALEAGARGYVSKNAAPEEVRGAISHVLAGGDYVEAEIARELACPNAPVDGYLRPLTQREIEVMRLLARGRSLTQIAATLGVAYKTAANTCTNIKEKLGVSRTADLIRISLDRGLV